jgi:cell wall-associated NlpC family hydrolase
LTPKYSKLIGISYSELNCWDIAREFYLLTYGIELKRYYDDLPSSRDTTKNLIYTNIGDFIVVDNPEFGDIVLIKLFGVESHIAIYLGDGKMLHTSIALGSHIDSINKWKKLIVNYYRVVND